MKLFYIKTDKSSGSMFAPSFSDIVIRLENSGHIILEIRLVTDGLYIGNGCFQF